MNKKTFTVAVVVVFVTEAWLTVNLVWSFGGHLCVRELFLPTMFVAAGVLMTWREFHRKKRKHVEDVKRYL